MKKNRLDIYFGAGTFGRLQTIRGDGWSVWDSLFADSLDEACTALARRLSFEAPAAATDVAFLNMHNYVVCPDTTRTVFPNFDFLFGDGVALQIAKLFISTPPFHRISGTDLVPALLKDTRCPPLRVFLLGGEQRVIVRAAGRFAALFPRHELVGYHHGRLGPSEDDRVVESINACRPDLLLIGMGTPLQERWLAMHRHRVKVRMSICVGGLFHYWHGGLKRAPHGLRRLGLEWLWILLQQPWKWRRYTIGPWKLLGALVRTRRARRPWS